MIMEEWNYEEWRGVGRSRDLRSVCVSPLDAVSLVTSWTIERLLFVFVDVAMFYWLLNLSYTWRDFESDW